MPEHDDDDALPMYVINHDAMYWRARAHEAEAALAALEKKYAESIDTGVRLADTSSRHLLTAIVAGAFDRKPPS